jgi:hypothetical protein
MSRVGSMHEKGEETLAGKPEGKWFLRGQTQMVG